MRSVRALTLIELLVVVAIITILAAIAVPNFLEAQTRAKTARVKSDLRSLATALESYFVDHGLYPLNSEGPAGGDPANGRARSFLTLPVLSTPIAYIQDSLLQDPFPSLYKVGDTAAGNYSYFNATEQDFLAHMIVREILSETAPLSPLGALVNTSTGTVFQGTISPKEANQIFRQSWFLTSSGPDRLREIHHILIEHGFSPTDTASPAPAYGAIGWTQRIGTDPSMVYDPTNGTISRGDIIRSQLGPFEPRLIGH